MLSRILKTRSEGIFTEKAVGVRRVFTRAPTVGAKKCSAAIDALLWHLPMILLRTGVLVCV